jgi:hypothetical protein
MDIPAGTKLYSYPTHYLTGRLLVLPMGIKVYPYPANTGTVPVPVGKIVILSWARPIFSIVVPSFYFPAWVRESISCTIFSDFKINTNSKRNKIRNLYKFKWKKFKIKQFSKLNNFQILKMFKFQYFKYKKSEFKTFLDKKLLNFQKIKSENSSNSKYVQI